ncbi:DUF302 domain-containing protein [bacterium]|nr:DUF302 domain-containing protein [bacterium]
MDLYLTRRLNAGFEETLEKLRLALLSHGFRLQSEVAVNAGQRGPLELPYRILAVSNPQLEFPGSLGPQQAPCLPMHIVVQRDRDGSVELSAMDPVKVMLAALGDTHREEALQTRMRMQKLLDSMVASAVPVQAA